jgi:MoxR-like ATPase
MSNRGDGVEGRDVSWWIYQGQPGTEPHGDINERLPEPPPWRRFDAEAWPLATPAAESAKDLERATTYRPDQDTIDRVNAALYLRRPLLVTGKPGTGKSTLAYAVAHELNLGKVLRWPITSRVTLRDGLYQYDPLGRLYEASRERGTAGAPGGPPHHDGGGDGGADRDREEVGRYIRLGPLGTALLPHERPRVLLIDEIDKGDLDLPNDLLTAFEEGEYEIPELARLGSTGQSTPVLTADRGEPYPIVNGQVRCRAFPFVVMTSNEEREFPPAFKRRCIQLELADPEVEELDKIIRAHLPRLADQAGDLIDDFLEARDQHNKELATDQLLNAVYLTGWAGDGATSRAALAKMVMSPLSPSARPPHAGR